MGFKTELKSLLEEKLNTGSASIIESIEDLAKDSGLTESQHTSIVTAVDRYTQSATDKLIDTIVEAAADKYDEKESELTESFEQKEADVKEAAENYATYIKEGADEYGEYVQEQYKTLAEAYVQDEVIPEITESVDAYMAIMATKLDEEGGKGINVLKASKYDNLVESLQSAGFQTKPLAESEEELSEIERLQTDLAEANQTIKDLGKQLSEASKATAKTEAEKVVDELTEGLSANQKDRVKRLASGLDENKEDYQQLVEEIVSTVKGKAPKSDTTLHESQDNDDNEGLNKGNAMDRYRNFAQPKQTRFA